MGFTDRKSDENVSVEMQRDDVEYLLQLTRNADAKLRKAAVRELCPCELKFNSQPVWDRLIEVAKDTNVGVRRNVLHVLCDGSPRERETDVVQAVEGMYQDPDRKLRRQVRNNLAHYRHTGKINVL